ncbi:hypothetical protein GWI33_011769 [Rhynchophorus ferrugineus]|uniref:Uncharacterized protein n=1 Tax=Rhynchophorus ferrugineus TaxID=354439 RepID=A0A834I994_RHYFE|nr:hypothetical protein GWI33_011769 [Rhynchophorus ferrugineus]
MHARFLYFTQSRTKVEDWLISLGEEEDLNILVFVVTPPEKDCYIFYWSIRTVDKRTRIVSAGFHERERENGDGFRRSSSQPDPASQVEEKREEEIKNKKEMKEIVPRVRRVRRCFF